MTLKIARARWSSALWGRIASLTMTKKVESSNVADSVDGPIVFAASAIAAVV